MGPKKAGEKATDAVDGVDTSKMNREQLEHYTNQILEEMEREREERNFFQLERDKLRTFWEITRHQLDEARATVRNKEREKEELSEKHEAELTLYKQKVKHLMYEHQTNLVTSKAEHIFALKMAQGDHILQEHEFVKDKIFSKKTEKETEIFYTNEVRALQLVNADEMSRMMKNFESEAAELEEKYEQKIATLYETLLLKHRTEIVEVEERKNLQISTLIHNHERDFADTKNYYNEITVNNLSLIKSLKEKIQVMKSQEERLIKQVRKANSEIKKHSVDLKKAQYKISDVSRRLISYEKDKELLTYTRKKLTATMKDHANMKREIEVLEFRLSKCKSERDELHSKFSSAILELQQKTGLKNVLLEKKIEKLTDMLEQREAKVNKFFAVAQLDPAVVVNVNEKLEEILNRKNMAIKDLQYELAKVCKAHDDILATYGAKLQEYGIPETDL
ncbi:dynein regulatory complex subunit 4 isoform X1 [Belonocnema kinseyi]|uniref:dynein regulatory complex subunit 4 isoform X1 n=1 Tax=Belonocnema kinseyi TaxID=2817044 RepID=UPI00143DC264|nr:dynein regulatory complex subunit 4 isoform X1 [Belonocnema kinseyi]